MKKVFMAILIAAFAKVSVQAQTANKNTEFYFTVNTPQSRLEKRVLEVYSEVTMGDFFRWFGFALVGIDTRRIRPFEENSASGQQATSIGVPFSIGFRNDLNQSGSLQMGLRFSHRQYRVEHFRYEKPSTFNKEMFNSLELELNSTWMRTPNVDCYSGLAVGGTLQHVTGHNNITLPIITSHLNLLGVRYKQGNTHVNLEVGMGSKGLASLGVGTKF
jgi:hypothetical protein